MRIHVISINYWPEETGIAAVTTGRAEYLAAQGHAVTVCTAMPYYPEWRVRKGYRRPWYGRERHNGVTVLRCPLYVPPRPTTVRRVLHEGSFVASAFLRSLWSPRPDVLVIVSPPLGLALVAALLGRWWRVPYLFDVEDLQPDTAVDLGMMRRGIVTRALYALERLAYRRAAVVSTLTDGMRARLLAKGLPPERTLRLGLWAEPELLELQPEPSDAALRAELGLGSAFVVLHVGNMGVKQGLDVVVDAALKTHPQRDIRYVLVGDGAVRASLEARARSLGLTNVSFIPLLPRPRFHRLLALADVCLVSQQRSVADVVFPSKVLTLLAAGKPVIAAVTDGSEVARIIRTASAGLVVTPEDPAALLNAVLRFRADETLRRQAADSARAFAREQWHRETTLAAFARALDSIAPNSRPREWSRAV